MRHKSFHTRRWPHRQQQHNPGARLDAAKIVHQVIFQRIFRSISRNAGRHGDKAGLTPRQIEDRRRDVGLMENDVGIANRLNTAQAEQPRITIPDIDNFHLCNVTVPFARDQPGKKMVSGICIAADNVICCRTIDNAVLDGAPPGR